MTITIEPLYSTIWTSDVPTYRQAEPMDTWLRMVPCDCAEDAEHTCGDECEAEANTFKAMDGTYVVEWSLTAVGLVTHVGFATYENAQAWLAAEGFEDYSS